MTALPVLLVLALFSSPLIPGAGIAGSASTTRLVTVEDDVTDRYWNQNLGSAAGDSAVDVAPVTLQPVELWRISPGELATDPIIWGDRIFVVVQKNRQLKLLALDAETGEQVASARLGKGDQPRIAVWQSLVAVLDEESLRTYLLKGKTLRKKKALDIESSSPPCLHGSLLFVNARMGGLQAIDIESGRLLGSMRNHGYGRPSCNDEYVATTYASGRSGYRGEYLYLRLSELPAPGAKEWSPRSDLYVGGMLADRATQDHFAMPFTPAGGSSRISAGTGTWYARCQHALRPGESGKPLPGEVFGPLSDGLLSRITGTPITWNDFLFGFDTDGELILQEADGVYRPVLGEAGLPTGAKVGPLSRARNVAYMNNFAVDLDARRVLWCLPDARNASPLIPLADERILYRAESGELVVLAAENAGGGATGIVEATSSRAPLRGSSSGHEAKWASRCMAHPSARSSTGRLRPWWTAMARHTAPALSPRRVSKKASSGVTPRDRRYTAVKRS